MNAIIFDLDGVLCHTDEYHYMAWKAIADELHIPFNREVNNQLRGVSRMESLKLILRNSPVCYNEQEKFLLAEKKNNIYRELLQNITSKGFGRWRLGSAGKAACRPYPDGYRIFKQEYAAYCRKTWNWKIL